MRPAPLAQACQESGARLPYLNPTFHHPTTHTTPLSRRSEVADVILCSGITLIEDEPYRDDGQNLQLSLRAPSMGCSALLLALVEQ